MICVKQPLIASFEEAKEYCQPYQSFDKEEHKCSYPHTLQE